MTTHSQEMEDLYVRRLTEWAQGSGIDNNPDLSHALVNMCESEIERRMLIELYFTDWGFVDWEGIEIFDATMPFPPSGKPIVLAPQFPFGNYSIDIAILVRGADGRVLRIAVECDGHDFHERTKQQAEHDKKRDREMQKGGFMVFRYTGSEIFRKCKDRAADIGKYVSDWIYETTKPKEK